jgi:hypothetical protein
MIERSKREMDALTKRYDHEIKLMEIAHKDATEIELEKQRAIIKTAETAIKASGDTMKIDYLASLASRSIVFQANEEKILKLKEFNEAKKSAENEIELIEARRKQKQIDDAKEVADDAKKRLDEIAAYRKKLAIDLEKILQEIRDENAKEELEAEAQRVDELYKQQEERIKNNLDEVYANTKKILKQQADEEFAITEEKNDKIIKSEEYVQDYRRSLLNKSISEIANGLAQVQVIYQQFGTALLSLSSAQTAQRVQDIDSEINKEKERANNEILLAGGNAEQKARIQAQSDLRIQDLERKKKQEQRKLAEQQKTFSKIEATIATSLSVARALSAPPGVPYTIPFGIMAGALGAIQIAAIASQPLPQYFKGTDFHQGGKAIVGEQGAELMVMPSGNLQLTPSHATVVDIPRGTEVIPNAETMRMLAMAGITRPEMIESRKDNRLLNELKELKQITAKNRPGKTNLTRNMATVYESRKVSETMTQKVRALSMGEFGL